MVCYQRLHQKAHMRPGRQSLPLNKRLLTIQMNDEQYNLMKDRLQDLELMTYGTVRNEKAVDQNRISRNLEIR